MTKIALAESELINRANKELESFPGYIEGMKIESARMEKHILVMQGFCFMDNGKPTSKTNEALTVYNEFAKDFATRYTLAV
jgi:hypothetical protein